MTSSDDVSYGELQRRALLAGDDACQPAGVLREKYGDVDDGLRADGSGGTVEADRHPEGQDGEEPPADVDIDVSTRGEYVAEVEREEHPALAIDRDVDLDRLDSTHPAKRLAEARKQIALAMDDLADAGGGRIPVVDDDGFEFSIVATDETVRLVQRADGDRDDVRLDRPDGLLVAKCLEVLTTDL